MTSLATVGEIAIRFLRASVQSGARPGDTLGPQFWPGKVHLPGLLADFPAGLDFAAQLGWVEKLPGDQLRLTDMGFAAARAKG
jgi:hypothetical protein